MRTGWGAVVKTAETKIETYWECGGARDQADPLHLENTGGSIHIRAVISVPVGCRITFRQGEEYPYCLDRLIIVGTTNPGEAYTDIDTFRDYEDALKVGIEDVQRYAHALENGPRKAVLSYEESEAIGRFARLGGRRWKSSLRRVWEAEDYSLVPYPDEVVIRDMRYRLGLRWLKGYRASRS